MTIATTGEEINVQILLSALKYLGRQCRQLNQRNNHDFPPVNVTEKSIKIQQGAIFYKQVE